jgi:protein translocase subunit secA
MTMITNSSSVPPGAEHKRGGGQGFVPGKKVKTWKASPQIYPTELTKETEKLLKAAVDFAVQTYGERSLSELEAEDKVAIASEKAPTDDPVIQKLREVYNRVRGSSRVDLQACKLGTGRRFTTS